MYFSRRFSRLWSPSRLDSRRPSAARVTLLLAYYRGHIFEAPRRRWMRPAAAVLCVSIVCSTVLLKQHSCIDVALGALLALVLDSAFTAAEGSERPPGR